MKVKILYILLYFWLLTWTICRNLVIFLEFWWILAIENLKLHLILALKILNVAFWLYIASTKKRAETFPISIFNCWWFGRNKQVLFYTSGCPWPSVTVKSPSFFFYFYVFIYLFISFFFKKILVFLIFSIMKIFFF